MRFLAVIIVLVTSLFSIQAVAEQDGSGFLYLTPPNFQLKDGRLTGELKDVPVQELLEELAKKNGFQLEFFDDLELEIDLFLDHITLEESIRRIMRQADLSYALFFSPESSRNPPEATRIRKLVVCKSGKSGRTTRSSHRPTQGLNRARMSPAPQEQPVAPRRGDLPFGQPQEERADTRSQHFRLDQQEQDVDEAPPADEEQVAPLEAQVDEEAWEHSRVELGLKGSPESFKKQLDKLSDEGKLSLEELGNIEDEMEKFSLGEGLSWE